MVDNKTYCPICDWSCPYCKKDGICTLKNPMDNCDDYYYYMNDNE